MRISVFFSVSPLSSLEKELVKLVCMAIFSMIGSVDGAMRG